MILSNPILSIITINRNNADGLRKTIESVLSQDVPDKTQVEYIIIDGASTDNSVEVIKSFENNQSNKLQITKWISEPDSGIYNAMNKGIKMATGEYLHMLNSGDFYEPNVLDDVLDKLNKKPDILLCAINHNNNGIIENTELRDPNFLKHGSMSHQGLIYSTKFHNEYLYDECYKFASDFDFEVKSFFNKELHIEKRFLPTVNFLIGGVGGSADSETEIRNIKEKYGFRQKEKLTLKKVIKWFVPFGILELLKKIRKIKRGKK